MYAESCWGFLGLAVAFGLAVLACRQIKFGFAHTSCGRQWDAAFSVYCFSVGRSFIDFPGWSPVPCILGSIADYP